MFFERFFKPKWQHPKAEVRKQALLKLSPQQASEQELLLKLATEDPDADVRRTAVKRVSDLAFLRRRMDEEANAGVREVASARYRQLLAGGMEDAGLQTRLAELALCGDEAVLTHVARRGREVELRLAALGRVHSAAVLEDAAINDGSPKVRQAAVARLQARDALERVLRQSKDRDRKVWRTAREAVDALERQDQVARQARQARAQICQELETLAEQDWHEGYAAQMQRLENRWQALQTPADAELQQRFGHALARCAARTRAKAERPASAPVMAQMAAAPRLDAVIAALEDDPDIESPRVIELQQQLDAAQDEVGTADEGERHKLRLLREYLIDAQRFLDHQAELEQALTGAKAVDAQDEAALKAAAQGLRRAVQRVAWSAALPPPTLLRQAQAELDDVVAREARAAAQRAEQLAAIEGVLEELEEQLKGGHLREAQRLLIRAQKAVEALPARHRGRLQRRLKAYAGRVGDLRDWRRFATLPKQAELCEQMEALVEAELEPPVRAERVKALQEEWKSTGGSDSAEAQQLWERFRSAGDRAFEPCRAYFAEQAELRERNVAERERIVRQLEEFIAQADWERLALQTLEAIRAQARREWQAAQPVERKANQAVQQRFEPLMDELTQHIRRKYDGHRSRKQELVRQAQALAAGEDLRAATDQVKALQALWRQVGPAQAAVDRKLWHEFRSACDAVFQRRQQVREQLDHERQAALAQAEALCQQLEALSEVEPAAAGARLRALEAEFTAVGALPRESARAVERRFAAAREAVAERLQAAARRQRRAALDAAHERAGLCARLEAAVLADEEQVLDAVRAEYEAAPPAPPALAAGLAQRWQRAVAAAEGEAFSEEELAAAGQRRRELCLRLEILAGIESPAEDRPLRMDLQVRRLNEGMTSGQRPSPADEARALEAEWLQVGPVARPQDELQARVRAALERLDCS
jgi:exonuclease SbcC